VEGIIEASAEDVNIASYPGYDDYIGWGRINAGKALERLHSPYQLRFYTATTDGCADQSSYYVDIPGWTPSRDDMHFNGWWVTRYEMIKESKSISALGRTTCLGKNKRWKRRWLG